MLQLLLLAAAAVLVDGQFGHDLLVHWRLDPLYTNLNHGSFGATPGVVTQALRERYDEMERCPDYWFRYNEKNTTLYGSLGPVLARIAKIINANSQDDVVFVDNASGGINAVLRSLTLDPTAKILYLILA
jgi:selenocysteine lyase/cysteine desulfurase